MALPKGKISRARGRSRRANWKLTLPGIVECPQCHQKKLDHRVCKHCGYYNGKQVIDMSDDKKKEILRQRFDRELKRGAADEKEQRKKNAIEKMIGYGK